MATVEKRPERPKAEGMIAASQMPTVSNSRMITVEMVIEY